MAQATQDGASPGSEEDTNGNDEGLIMNLDGIIKVYYRYPLPVEEPSVPHWMKTAPTDEVPQSRVLKRKVLLSTSEENELRLATKCDRLSARIDNMHEEAHEYFTDNQEYIDYLLNKDTPIGVTVVTPLGRIEYDLEQWEGIFQMLQATRFMAAEHHADLENALEKETSMNANAFLRI